MRFQREPMKRLATRCAGWAFVLCALGGALSARAVPVVVADANELYTRLGAVWSGGDLEFELPPGDYDLSLSNLNLVGAVWAASGILPGNLSLVGRGFPGEVRVATSNVTLKVSPGLSLNMSNLKFSGAVASTGNAIITLNRVWWASPTPMIIPPSCTLNMDSSVVQGGGFAVRGGLNVRRCTFISGDLNLTGSTGLRNIDTSIFMTPPIGVDAGVTGVMNFIAGGGTTFPQPNFAVATTPPAPIFTPNSGSVVWWPGKLQFSLYPRIINIAAPTGPSLDFEGEVISGRPEIGADEVDANLPTPSWAVCQVSGPNGATIYDDVPNRQVPIVSNGTPVTIRIVTRGLITPAMQSAGVALNMSVVITPEIDPDPSHTTAFEIPIPFTDIRALGTTQDFEFTTTFAARDANPTPIDAFDGYAQVHLKVEGSYLSATLGGTTARDREFLIDSLPPLLPPAAGDSTAYDLVTSTTDTDGIRVCGGWVRNDSTNTAEGSIPQYLFNSTGILDYTLTVPLVDNAGSGGHSVSGFQAAGTLLQDTFGDLANVPERDPVLRNATWGTASLTNDALRTAAGTALAASSVNGPPAATISGVTEAAIISVGGFTDTSTPPKVRKWDMNLRIADRAGNTTVLAQPVRFWWMPPGSTWANVLGDNRDPISPSFSWDLTLNGESGSVKDFFTCGLRPEAQILLMQQTSVTTDANEPGWESVAGLNWTVETTESSVDSTTVIGRDPDTAVLGDLMRGLLGQNLVVVVRATDPAGNVQNVLGLENSPYATTATLAQLNAANIYYGGVYTIPSTPPLGSLDTGVSARFFLNRTDSGNLWLIDDNETTLGSGPTVPLTPLNACSQRLEAEFTVNIGTSNQLPSDRSVVGVEFWLYEGGNLVARGNLYQKEGREALPMRLLVPTDLLDVANGGNANPDTAIFVPSGVTDAEKNAVDKYARKVDRNDVAKFLNAPPQVCADLGGGADRLGDDGAIVKPGATKADGTLLVGARSKPVQYTLVLQATTNILSVDRGNDLGDLVDSTPATYRFTVVPDLKPDSENPRVKVNTNNP